jgi:ketosteroid isomerase-like protein
MNNTEIVQEITNAFCENRLDQQTLAKYFAQNFEHTANDRRTDLKGYSEHLANYMREYKKFRLRGWDELFSAGDKVIASYTLEAEKDTGGQDQLVVMAIWRLADGKVVSLREVDAKLAKTSQAAG